MTADSTRHEGCGIMRRLVAAATFPVLACRVAVQDPIRYSRAGVGRRRPNDGRDLLDIAIASASGAKSGESGPDPPPGPAAFCRPGLV